MLHDEHNKDQIMHLSNHNKLLVEEREALILTNSDLTKQLDEFKSKYLIAITVISEIDLKLSYFKRLINEKHGK